MLLHPLTQMVVHRFVYDALHYRVVWRAQPVITVFNLSKHTEKLEEILMANKKQHPQSNIQKPDYAAVKWVNRQLTAEEKEQHDNGVVKPEKTFKDLLALALQGYNIAIKWDGYSSCYQTTLIPYNAANPNYGYGLSARAAEPYRAISLLLFKHYEVLQEDWQRAYKPSSNSLEG